MVNAHVVVIVHVNSSTQKLINLSTYSPLQGEGLGVRLLVYSSTRQLKKMSLFLTNATRKIEKMAVRLMPFRTNGGMRQSRFLRVNKYE